jgi:hypothetical protein
MTVTGLALSASFGMAHGAAQVTSYWDFNGTGGDELADSAGPNADNFTNGSAASFLSGGPSQTTGSQYASFDGSGGLYTPSHSSDLLSTPAAKDAYSISFWVKANDAAQENSNTRMASFTVDGSGPQLEGFGQGTPNPGGMQWRKDDFDSAYAAGSIVDSGTPSWNHVVIVMANDGGTGSLSGDYSKAYVNGTLVRSNDGSGNTGQDLGNVGNSRFTFGSNKAGNGSRDFVGDVDDLALYEGVVTSQQAADLANGDITPSAVPEPASLVLMGLGGLLILPRYRRKA